MSMSKKSFYKPRTFKHTDIENMHKPVSYHTCMFKVVYVGNIQAFVFMRFLVAFAR